MAARSGNSAVVRFTIDSSAVKASASARGAARMAHAHTPAMMVPTASARTAARRASATRPLPMCWPTRVDEATASPIHAMAPSACRLATIVIAPIEAVGAASKPAKSTTTSHIHHSRTTIQNPGAASLRCSHMPFDASSRRGPCAKPERVHEQPLERRRERAHERSDDQIGPIQLVCLEDALDCRHASDAKVGRCEAQHVRRSERGEVCALTGGQHDALGVQQQRQGKGEPAHDQEQRALQVQRAARMLTGSNRLRAERAECRDAAKARRHQHHVEVGARERERVKLYGTTFGESEGRGALAPCRLAGQYVMRKEERAKRRAERKSPGGRGGGGGREVANNGDGGTDGEILTQVAQCGG
eukprot:scaffold61313_cov30-Tisochrysis_lutea.AAC.2